MEEKKKIIALRDFVIFQNDEKYEIKEGVDIGKMDIPEKFFDNLVTEKVIKKGDR